MKPIFERSAIVSSILLLAVFASCKDYNEVSTRPVDSGQANFSKYVSVGNSLTAGFQNNALYQSAQKFSYPNLLARQFNEVEQFTQPLISDPGIGGRIELTSLNPLGTTMNQQQGKPINQGQKPYRNLGVPGAVLADYANPNNAGRLKERATDPSNPAFNPFYGIVLEQSELAKPAPNIHDEVARQHPSFVTFWLGNDDVLGFVTSGGEGQSITPPVRFTKLYQASARLLKSTGADAVVYTIPNVTNIPFVFTVRAQLAQQGTIKFDKSSQSYELVTPQGDFTIFINVNGTPEPLRKDDFLLLNSQSYFSKVENGSVPPPIKPRDAIPDRLVLDGNTATPAVDSELEKAVVTVKKYNAAIRQIAAQAGFAVVDVNKIFSRIVARFRQSGGGYNANGLVLTPTPGSLFTFDGVHVSNRGAALIADETIKEINHYYSAKVPLIDISDIPQGLPVVSGGANR